MSGISFIKMHGLGNDFVIIDGRDGDVALDAEQARAIARAALEPYMPLPNYFKNWLRLGFTEDDVKDGGSDRLMDAMVLWGEADEIRAKLEQYFAEGADQVVIQAIRADGQPGPDWDALAALAPGA